MSSLLDQLNGSFRSRVDTVLTDAAGEWDGARLGACVDHWRGLLDRQRSQRVAWQLPNGAEWVALDLALLMDGRVAVPIPDFFTAAQVTHAVDAAGIDTFISRPSEAPLEFTRIAHSHGLDISARTVREVPGLHAGTAKISFTSGSTGAPKGVCLHGDQLLRIAQTLEDTFSERNIRRHLSALPLSLLLENVAGVYASLLNGSRIDLPPLTELGISGSSQMNVAEFIKGQHRFQPESIILVPQLLLVLLSARALGARLPSSYRMIAVGGARVAPHLLSTAAALHLPVFEGYGLSECGSVVSLNRPGANRPGSVGKPLPHAAVTVQNGEIHVGRCGMLGYLGEEPAPEVIATGDLGHFDGEGYLYIDGRIRNCFITAFGRNVNPEWIESELTAQPDVASAAVFGESLPGNIAVIMPRETGPEGMEATIQVVNRRLPDYARIAEWIVVKPGQFRERGCLTGSGKVRRDRIAAAWSTEINAAASRLRSQATTGKARNTAHVR